MDDFTNYMLSGALGLMVWVIGAVYIHYTSPSTDNYLGWAKICVIVVPAAAVAFSLALAVIAPPPELQKLGGIDGITQNITDQLNGSDPSSTTDPTTTEQLLQQLTGE